MTSKQGRPPREIAVGETATWTLALADHPPADGWACSIYFRGPAEVDLVGVVDGAAFDFAVASASFSVVGTYKWEAIATKTGERCRVSAGRLLVVADLAAVSNLGDFTSHNERMLAALEASLEGVAAKAQRSYTIDGRSLERMTLEELRRHRDIYARRVKLERELEALGLDEAPKKVLTVLR